MKTTKLFLAAVIIFFGVILSDGNAKPANSNNDNSERPRRRIVLVTTHCYVRPVVYAERRERWEYRENEGRREYRERRENREHREHDRR